MIAGALLTLSCASIHTNDRLLVGTAQLSADSSLENAQLMGGLGHDRAMAINCRVDQSCTLVGETWRSFASEIDLLALGMSPGVQPIWARTYGGNNDEELHAAIRTSDGGFLLAASSESFFFTFLGGTRAARPLLLRLGPMGEVQWAVTIERGVVSILGGTESRDGGFLITGIGNATGWSRGRSTYETALIKLTAGGAIEWASRYKQDGIDFGTDVAELADGRIMIAGLATGPDTESDYLLTVMMASAQGHPIWMRRYEGASIYPGNISLSAGKELTLAGSAFKGETRDPFAVRIDTEGRPIWAWSYLLPGDEMLDNLREDEQGHLLLAGADRLSESGSFEGWAVLLDELGVPLGSTGLKGARSSLSDGQQIGRDRHRLVGETTQLGANGLDAICMDWSPGAASISEFEHVPVALVPETVSVTAERFKPRHSWITEELETRTLILGD